MVASATIVVGDPRESYEYRVTLFSKGKDFHRLWKASVNLRGVGLEATPLDPSHTTPRREAGQPTISTISSLCLNALPCSCTLSTLYVLYVHLLNLPVGAL